ncbi:MAG: hypothetical protein LBK29_03280 [Oscillospiraceae bacterium]|nr:hypothetical protein [Oscillospiraceae bacterium]
MVNKFFKKFAILISILIFLESGVALFGLEQKNKTNKQVSRIGLFSLVPAFLLAYLNVAEFSKNYSKERKRLISKIEERKQRLQGVKDVELNRSELETENSGMQAELKAKFRSISSNLKREQGVPFTGDDTGEETTGLENPEEKIAGLEAEVSILQEEKKAELIHLNQTIAELRKEIEVSSRKFSDDCERERDALFQRVRGDELEMLKKKKDKLRGKFEPILREITEVKEAKKEFIKSHDSLVLDLEKRSTDLSAEDAKLQAKFKIELDSLRERQEILFLEKKKELEESEARIAALQARLDSIQEKNMSDLRARIAASQTELDSTSQEERTKNDELQAVSDLISQKRARLTDLTAKIAELNEVSPEVRLKRDLSTFDLEFNELVADFTFRITYIEPSEEYFGFCEAIRKEVGTYKRGEFLEKAAPLMSGNISPETRNSFLIIRKLRKKIDGIIDKSLRHAQLHTCFRSVLKSLDKLEGLNEDYPGIKYFVILELQEPIYEVDLKLKSNTRTFYTNDFIVFLRELSDHRTRTSDVIAQVKAAKYSLATATKRQIELRQHPYTAVYVMRLRAGAQLALRNASHAADIKAMVRSVDLD